MEYWDRRCKENIYQCFCLERNLSSHLILPHMANKEVRVRDTQDVVLNFLSFKSGAFSDTLLIVNLEVTELEKGCRRGLWKLLRCGMVCPPKVDSQSHMKGWSRKLRRPTKAMGFRRLLPQVCSCHKYPHMCTFFQAIIFNVTLQIVVCYRLCPQQTQGYLGILFTAWLLQGTEFVVDLIVSFLRLNGWTKIAP